MANWNFCSSAAAIAKAGANANSTIVASSATLDAWSGETEGFINAETRRDWITDIATTNFKGTLAEVASAHIANKIINYDMSGYTSRLEAGTMMDVNADNVRKGIAFLKLDEHKEVME